MLYWEFEVIISFEGILNKMKICYCVEGLYNSRGTERVLTECVNLLSDEMNITIATAFQGGRPDFYILSPKVRRIDLGVTDYQRNSLFHNPRKKDYRRKLTAFLLKEKFDIVVSLGGLESQFLHKIKDGSKKVLWFHFAFDISNLFIRERHKGLVADLMVWLQTKRRVWFANRMDQLVVLSKSDCEKWSKYCKNATYIYNPITISTSEVSKCEKKSAIAVGVLGVQKGFDYLIDAWALVAKKHPEWHLDIFGDGPDRKILQERINTYNLQEKIILQGKTDNIEKEYVSHSIYVMSSRAEGFGLVLVEASACGLPLISYDCNYGPNEIIVDGKNGILVSPVGDVKGLSDAIIYLIEDSDKRKAMGVRAKELSCRFNGENVKKNWINLLSNL